MASFLIAKRDDTPQNGQRGVAAARAIAAMQARGLRQVKTFERPGFELFLYRKRRFETSNYLEFENGDFIIAVGTMLYKDEQGSAALEALYRDFATNGFSFEHALGHFGVVVFCDNKLVVFNDYRGMCQIYTNSDQSILSTSFLAVYETLDSYTANDQEIYEYLHFLMFFGNRTPIAEIERLDKRYIHEVLPGGDTRSKPFQLPDFYDGDDLERHVDQIHGLLSDYFAKITTAFGDDISIGLTGGYDSRLILAHLRNCGCNPRVYVQGADDLEDVKIAKQIADFVGFDIEHDPDEAALDFDIDDFEQRLTGASRYIDGFSHRGLFDKWPLIAAQRGQVERPERLRLYGMAGEIFRKLLELPSQSVPLPVFFRIQADKFDTSAYTGKFSKKALFRAVGRKMTDELQLDDGVITAVQAESAYPVFRLPCITGMQLTNENERAHALVPYAEPLLVEASYLVPMRYRDVGRLNAMLIERADKKLAAAPSAYGFTFSDGPSLKKRVRQRIVRALPTRVRPLAHRIKKRMARQPEFPFYLNDEFVGRVFPDGVSEITEYIHLDRIRRPDLLSRALTLELLLTGRLGEVSSKH